MEWSVEQKILLEEEGRGINSFLINPLNAQNKPKTTKYCNGNLIATDLHNSPSSLPQLIQEPRTEQWIHSSLVELWRSYLIGSLKRDSGDFLGDPVNNNEYVKHLCAPWQRSYFGMSTSCDPEVAAGN